MNNTANNAFLGCELEFYLKRQDIERMGAF
jgi:hypothetical protein